MEEGLLTKYRRGISTGKNKEEGEERLQGSNT